MRGIIYDVLTRVVNRARRLALVVVCLVAAVAQARNVYITPDADGTGDGTSWSSPMMLTNYLVKAKANGDVVRLKAGKYTAQIAQQTFGNSMTIKISGGYAGTDDTTLDAENPISDIDFANYPTSGSYAPFLLKANSGYSMAFERLRLSRARNVVFYKSTNAGDLYLSDCVIVSNGWRNYNGTGCYGGRGIHSEGGKLYMTNCVVAYNGMYSYPSTSPTSSYGDNGFGLYLKNTQTEMVGCKVYGNGSRINLTSTEAASKIVRGGGKGMAVYATGSTKLMAIGCDFVCNKSPMGTYNSSTESATGVGAGGTVAFDSATGSGAFSNCSFIANMNVRDHSYGRYNLKFGGALAVNMSSPAKTVDVYNCTFAYNMTDSPGASAGLDAWNGTVNVRNSVFVGNSKPSTSSIGSDIHVRTGAVVNVSHTLFDAAGADDARHFSTETIAEDSGTLNLGAGVVFGDALLASATLASTNLIVNATKKIQSATLPIAYYNTARIDEVLAFDIHPRSKAGRWTKSGYVIDTKQYSPAIDAADPDCDVGLEPKPNGKRKNLGRYGGTAEASLTFEPLGTVIRLI